MTEDEDECSCGECEYCAEVQFELAKEAEAAAGYDPLEWFD